MEIIPAIDIIKGKCVRLTKGDYKLKKVYRVDPLEMAKLFERTGLKRLHLIDLEGAKTGEIKNWKTIKIISQKTNLNLEVGGGIRSSEDIKKLLTLGIDRVILGSLAVKSPEKLEKFLEEFGSGKIIVDIGIKKDKIYFRGWQEKTEKDINSFLKNLIELGVKTIVLTDIERDGTLKGPNFSLYQELVKKFPTLEIIASGGVRNEMDLEKLSEIGVQGVIVGKAIYENKIPINELKKFL